MHPPARHPRATLRLLLCAALALVAAGTATPHAQTDLDAFMHQVVETRDTNWKKLQQYILDEREQVEMRGPAGRHSGVNAAITAGTSATASSSGAR